MGEVCETLCSLILICLLEQYPWQPQLVGIILQQPPASSDALKVQRNATTVYTGLSCYAQGFPEVQTTSKNVVYCCRRSSSNHMKQIYKLSKCGLIKLCPCDSETSSLVVQSALECTFQGRGQGSHQTG